MRRSAFLAVFAGAVIVACSALIGLPLVLLGSGPPPGQEFVLSVAAVLIVAGFGLRVASAVAGSDDDHSGDHDDGPADADSAEHPGTPLGRIANLVVTSGALVFLAGFVFDLASRGEPGPNIGAGIILLASGAILVVGVFLSLIAAAGRRAARRAQG